MSVSIENWLDQLGLGKYAGAFIENDVDVRALPYLTETDLRELGVSLGTRRVLLAATAKLMIAPEANPDPRGTPEPAATQLPRTPDDDATHQPLTWRYLCLAIKREPRRNR